MNRDIALV